MKWGYWWQPCYQSLLVMGSKVKFRPLPVSDIDVYINYAQNPINRINMEKVTTRQTAQYYDLRRP